MFASECHYYAKKYFGMSERGRWQEIRYSKRNSYAALMCRAKQRRYLVLEQVTELDGTPQENA